MDQLKKILNPKIWLIITALIHAVVGIILDTDWADDPQVLIGGFMLLTSVTMLYLQVLLGFGLLLHVLWGSPGK